MVLVTGSLAYDQIMDFPGKFSDHIMPDKIHMLNVSFLVNNFRKGFGGTAGNIAYTLSLLDIKSAILGMAGDDFEPYRKFLERFEVNTSNIKIINKFQTSAAFGITDQSDNQIWGFYTGADSLSDQLSTDLVHGKIDFAIIAPHNPKAMLKFSLEHKNKGIPYLFDPGMQLPWFTGPDLLKAFTAAEIIIGNDYEIDVMEKKTGIFNLHKHFKDKIIITTLAEKGSTVSRNGKLFQIKSSKVKHASDPAGAGDAYRAGFVAGYLRGFPVKTCAQMGSVTSAYTVEKYGTTTHYFTVPEFTRRYRDNYGEELALT
ncbi:hypothetical protein A3D05_04065 [Candidatus Gottesmanbacteria bacterium RIFCSPHIGHO2_02_FULL_40_24]|uniref:Carbohydrate kinase PfkB domain-containing protein n=1 Tax=Candidatus Gottesmanbacteria bacterium RIFCSPHIGHO2_01_FULL_40_15 TaxID=1798376 RepID=A0A1F5Z0P7_9BACT|nr:MAG: hypothetical protein A2777_00855 [Candidatus Gottesmanbacteria bacterium RIFCSPHIGHO2_01_FULL_40_15]OGG17482.1 MAG: hypothetical protein A3D05_04065 [Candidatus Gottesmanbacteria bacterium RIFCSPHIGHO2_02_FULL_40_24]OGG21513.1 MAG: hypothetical protein A3B48_01845 [Candidatus Gottesmanbacteria bacterium RIFCSPLOWO2_01_FULL_40_10]OGG25125.1 MAG: hypothetical protein A3E42_00980 [Candidatus Gottesmanbacteria bacterium RIFCSPHIGHO2_12_FULL_40_13]OGG32754.1 MAG: hypothetical protein A3I80_0